MFIVPISWRRLSMLPLAAERMITGESPHGQFRWEITYQTTCVHFRTKNTIGAPQMFNGTENNNNQPLCSTCAPECTHLNFFQLQFKNISVPFIQDHYSGSSGNVLFRLHISSPQSLI